TSKASSIARSPPRPSSWPRSARSGSSASRLLKKQMTKAFSFRVRRIRRPSTTPAASAARARAARESAETARATTTARSTSCSARRQVTDSDQVVDREREGKHPIHAPCPAVARLPHQADRLEPAEDFLE